MLNGERKFDLRPARADDYGFAERLYLTTMTPLLGASGEWNETRLSGRLKRSFRLDEVQIITVNGTDVGWLQVSESDAALILSQVHIEREFRSRGIGTQLIRELMVRARGKEKYVSLSVVRGNPAVALYRRLGFKVVGGNRHRLRMRWEDPGDCSNRSSRTDTSENS